MNVSMDLIAKMKKAGFVDLDCNPESASAATLKSLGKLPMYSVEHLENSARIISGAHIPSMWFFLFGAPGETENSILETFTFIDRFIPKNHLCVIAAGIRINSGSPLHKWAMQQSLLERENNLLLPTFYENTAMPRDKLLYLVNLEVLQRPNCLYLQEDKYRPDLLIKTIRSIYKRFGITRPLWQDEILIRRSLSMLGVAKYKQFRHRRQYTKVRAQLEIEGELV